MIYTCVFNLRKHSLIKLSLVIEAIKRFQNDIYFVKKAVVSYVFNQLPFVLMHKNVSKV